MSLRVRPIRPWSRARATACALALGSLILAASSLHRGRAGAALEQALARRHFLVLPPEGLDLDAAGIPDALSATLLLESAGPSPAAEVQFEVTWLDQRGQVLAKRSWGRVFLPPPLGAAGYVSLRGASLSRPRVVRLSRRDFPPGTARLRLAVEGAQGKVLARLYSRVRRVPRVSVNPSAVTAGIGPTWDWKPITARRPSGRAVEHLELLRRYPVAQEQGLSGPEERGWEEVGPGRPLAFDLLPGAYRLERSGEVAGALLEHGRRPRPLPSGQLVVEAPATLSLSALEEARVRLTAVSAGGGELAVARGGFATPTYLVGPSAEVTPWTALGGESSRAGDAAPEPGFGLRLPKRPGGGALQLRVRGLSGLRAPRPESRTITLRWTGGGERPDRVVRVPLPPPEGERLPWPGARVSGAQHLTLSVPQGAREVRVEASALALIDASWVAALRRSRVVQTPADTELCRLVGKDGPVRWRLPPVLRVELEAAGRRVLLERALGAVRAPLSRAEQAWRFRSLTAGPETVSLLFPPSPPGTRVDQPPSLGSRRLLRLRGRSPAPQEILVPGATQPRQVLAPNSAPPTPSYAWAPAEPVVDRVLRTARLATPSAPLDLEFELRATGLLVLHTAAVSSASQLDVDLVPMGPRARRAASLGPATPLRQRFILPAEGEPALRLEPGHAASGPCARVALGLGTDLEPGRWRVRLRPSGPLWLAAALGTPSPVSSSQPATFWTHGVERIDLGPSHGLSLTEILADRSHAPLADVSQVSSRAVGLRVSRRGAPLMVLARGVLPAGQRVTLPRAELRREAKLLPCRLTLPRAEGALRLWVYRTGDRAGSPLEQGLSLDWGVGGAKTSWAPEFALRPGATREGDPGPVWQASRVFAVPALAQRVRVSGPEAESLAISAAWLRARPVPTVIRDLPLARHETLWREGVWAKLPLPPPTHWVELLPPELVPVSSAAAVPARESIPLALARAEDRVELWEPIQSVAPRPGHGAPAPVWRPLQLGVDSTLRVGPPSLPAGALATLRVRYQGLNPERLPLSLGFSWRGRVVLRERLYVPTGEVLLRDLPAGAGVLRAEGSPHARGRLWVRLEAPPTPGDLRVRNAWVAEETGPATFALSARPGDLLQLEVFAAGPGEPEWRRWELELRDRSRLLWREVHWSRSGVTPFRDPLGAEHRLQARVTLRLDPPRAEATSVVLRGAVRPGTLLRGVLLRAAQ